MFTVLNQVESEEYNAEKKFTITFERQHNCQCRR